MVKMQTEGQLAVSQINSYCKYVVMQMVNSVPTMSTMQRPCLFIFVNCYIGGLPIIHYIDQ